MDAQLERNTMAERTVAMQDRLSPDDRLWVQRPNQTEILQKFSPEEQKIIHYRHQILTPLASFIGKDFKIPVDLNVPGGGWYWNFKENRIAIDPVDLLQRELDENRFIICHEGSHRRISRMEVIPFETWTQPGFASLVGKLEDPRVNNFLAEAYPRINEPMRKAYKTNAEFEAKAKAEGKNKLGQIPRFVTAGFEYIKQWSRESQGQAVSLSEDLPDDVRQVVEATLDGAREAWLTYPSREEANQGEEVIRRYAEASTKIMEEKVWPEFKKLVDKDIEDQEKQEAMKDMNKDNAEGNGDGVPKSLGEKLIEDEKQELEKALEDAMNGTPSPAEPGQSQLHPIDLDSLSEGLKQKLQDYIDSLPEDVKRKLAEKAKQAIKEYQKGLDVYLEGKLSDNPERKAEREAEEAKDGDKKPITADTPRASTPYDPKTYEDQRREFRDIAEAAIKRDETMYEKTRQEVLPIIDELENDLRDIFVQRRANQIHGGFRSGKRVDIIKRIQEKAKGISAIESRAWERRDQPDEKDYAITMLIDLSGSMQGEKIDETFKAAIVLAEVLNRLSIKTEIIGFNDRIYEYQSFGQPMSKDIRDKMGGMLREVSDTSDTGRARWNDDGWALEQASGRLAKQREATEKFLLVLSDGQPIESSMHPRERYNLSTVIRRIMNETDQKLIGLGIGPDTNHVAGYYPNSVSSIGVKEMAEKLADVIREAIANYDTF